jgi:probable HAF family extracellular repeat protein
LYIGLQLAGLATAAGWAAPAHADPAKAHWTVSEIGTLGGTSSVANSVNNAGQVAGYSTLAGNAVNHAFLYSNGVLTDIGTIGGTGAFGQSINNSGQVAGYSNIAGDSAFHAFLFTSGAPSDVGTLGGTASVGLAVNDAGRVAGYSSTSGNAATHAFSFGNGVISDLGTLGGTTSVGTAINSAGQVAGYSSVSGNLATHAFLFSSGSMTDLGTIGGSTSIGNGINASGQVVGYSNTAGNLANHAFLYQNGGMFDLGTLGGVGSFANGINTAGQVVGSSNVLGSGTHAFVWNNGTMVDLNNQNGVAASGLVLTSATAVNDAGQIVGTTSGSRGFMATLDTTVWESSNGGLWDSNAGWTVGIGPNKNTTAFIDPTRSLTVTGPAGAVTLRSLNVGGDATGNNGIATLNLNGGQITATGNAGAFVTVSAKGVLGGDGVIVGAVDNLGTVNATNLTLVTGLNNSGTVTGNGLLTTNLNNTALGTVQVGAGQVLSMVGNAHGNSGVVQVIGGGSLAVTGSLTNNAGGQVYINGATAQFGAAVTNAAGGRIQFNNANARFVGGLTNGGQVLVATGGAEVFGPVTTLSGGQVIFSGNSTSTLYDAVDIKSGGELRVSTGSVATFFGQVSQRTGSIFSGTGTKFYEGGLSIGGSPGLGIDQGNVSLGAGGQFLAEIGGTLACTAACATDLALQAISYDKYVVQGHLALGGTLKLTSWNSFVAQAGMSFDLLDWGSLSGTFDRVDAGGLRLAAGTTLDYSKLYTDGVIKVSAVPEPSSIATFSAGLLGLAFLATRRRREAARGRRG